MAQLLVPDKKVKVIGRDNTLKLRDEDCFPYDFSPVDLVTKWNEEVRIKIPANWGWILAKLQKTAPGILVNSSPWKMVEGKGAALDTPRFYHWDPIKMSCTCPAYRMALANQAVLESMKTYPWCKHLTLVHRLSPHFTHPLEDPHGFISFQVAGEFMEVDNTVVHSLVRMRINDDYWEYPQTSEGHKLLFDRLTNAHSKGYQIHNLIEVRG